MKPVYDAENNIEAHLVMHQLQQAGIKAEVQGGFLQGGVGELPTLGNVRVLVDPRNYAEARQVIEDWEASEPDMPDADQ